MKRKEYREPTTRTIAFTMALSFVIPVVIMMVALLKIQVWPGGKFTLLTYDMKAQFAPVISSLRYIGKSDNSLFLSFYGALANNAFLNQAAYIIDPSIWITVFFPIEQLPTVLYFILLFKIGLCGTALSAFFFFGTKEKKYSPIILALSICYALMSYNIMYSQCLLWYNVIALAPLILIGIERIIEGKRGGVYILCMTLALFYNYQLAYMIGIFSVMYLVWRLTEKNLFSRSIIRRFIVCNVLCAGMFMLVFIPTMNNILGGRMKTYNYRSGTYFYYSLWSVMKQLLSCRYDTIESGGLPMIFCGTLIPLLALLSFVLPFKPIAGRVASACITIFFVASFCIVPLNQFWHGFNEPNSFPVRYSFLFCLFMIILAYRTICYFARKNAAEGTTLTCLCGFALLISCIEMYLNAGVMLTSLNIENNYDIDSMYQAQVKGIKTVLDSIDDDDFFRVGRDIPYTYNDGMLFGYNGIGYFSSMFERDFMEFSKHLGYSQYEHNLNDSGGTPLTESILGVRYKVLWNPEQFGYYEKINQNGRWELQYNRDALPLGIMIGYGNSIAGREDLEAGIHNHNSFSFQEYLLSNLKGERVKAFDNIDYILEDINSDDYERHVKMRFIATSDKPIWIYCRDDHDGNPVIAEDSENSTDEADGVNDSLPTGGGGAILKVNGNARYPFADSISTLCICLGRFEEGEQVEVEAACTNAFDDPWIVYYNEEDVSAALQEIKKTPLEITEHRNGVIKGMVNVPENKDLMVMTLPYMRGYRVKVDGNRVDYGEYSDALLAFPLDPGEHTIEISFVPYGLIPGAVIGMSFLVLTIVYLIYNPKCKRNIAE